MSRSSGDIKWCCGFSIFSKYGSLGRCLPVTDITNFINHLLCNFPPYHRSVCSAYHVPYFNSSSQSERKKSITGLHVDSCQHRSDSAKGLFIKPPGAKADGFLQLLDIFCCYTNRLDGFWARGNNIIPKPSNVIQGLEPIHKAIYIGL